jgi:hypothetical protein
MKHLPSFPVTVTTRVEFHEDVDRALFEFEQRELLRFIIYRLQILQEAMSRVERLWHIAADVSEL